MDNIWNKLPNPIFCLAPMEGATDTVFRQIMVQLGKPHLMFTEFTSVDSLNSRGRLKTLESLKYSQTERPLIAQLWGLSPDNFFQAAKLIVGLGFDGIDINFGCPDRAVIKKGACSAMINFPDKAVEIIKATKLGCNNKLPVSVKTRIGFNTIVTETWCKTLLETDLDALTIHPRTAKELSKVPARWSEVAKVVNLRNSQNVKTKIIGNGDVNSLDQAKQYTKLYGVDGVMIGRGVFHNPWLFNSVQTKKSKQEKLIALNTHSQLFFDTYGTTGKSFHRLKRFVNIYLKGFSGAIKLKQQFMETNDSLAFRQLLQSSLS